MTKPEDQHSSPQDEFEIPAWDAAAIMRKRADDSRSARDAAIADLRQSMSDQEILVEFGIDLGQIED